MLYFASVLISHLTTEANMAKKKAAVKVEKAAKAPKKAMSDKMATPLKTKSCKK